MRFLSYLYHEKDFRKLQRQRHVSGMKILSVLDYEEGGD